jgi:predicted enzyme related to lactoylglutathione lyase
MELLINIDVDDLARATAFYVGGLGLREGRRFGDDGIELLGGSSKIYLLKKSAGTVGAPGATRTYDRHWTPVHIDLVVEGDLEAAVERARAAGAVVEQPVVSHAWGRIAMLADPFGHGICLLQFSPRGYDAIAT